MLFWAGLAVFLLGAVWSALVWLGGRNTRVLRSAVAGATRLRVRTGGAGCCGPVDKEVTLIDVRDAAEIRRIVGRIRVKQNWLSRSECSCCGWPSIEFYEGGKLLVTLSCHHGHSLRWRDGQWDGDVELTSDSASFLNSWLSEHGATENQRRARQAADDPPP